MVAIETFDRTNEKAPRFLGRACASFLGLGGRVYFHEAGFDDVYDSFQDGLNHLGVALINNPVLSEGTDYFWAGLWGDEGDKMIDFFRWSGVADDWSLNPGMISFVLRNGVYQPDDREVTCEDGAIAIIGAEARHRRQSRSLAEYLAEGPNLEADGLRVV